jgi:glycosyltransferase involved in cell wall biosynthesis
VSRECRIIVASHAWYGDVVGGAFRLASEFAEYLAEQGHSVSYLCCAKEAVYDGPLRETVRGVEIVRYRPSAKPLGGLARLRFHLRESRKLATLLNKESPVQFVSGHSPLQSLGAVQAFKQSSVHCNYTVHSPFDDELLSNSSSGRPGIAQRIASLVARRVDRRNCQLADQVQCDSRYTLSVMTQRHRRAVGNKGLVAPGWVESTRFVPAGDRLAIRHVLGEHWNVDCPVFFTLRRLQNRMGLETLVDACHLLAQRGLKFRTLIGGGGSLRESLQERINSAGMQQSVLLLGRLPEEQLADCYAAADCFVLPTKALECFGLIVLEAFACNTPVIASNVAAIPELAERQGLDWMFEPGDVKQLADRMQAFLEQRLKPTIDLRSVAMEYDKPKVLAEWERILVGSRQ